MVFYKVAFMTVFNIVHHHHPYYIVHGCQATILKANEKLNEEEWARGRAESKG